MIFTNSWPVHQVHRYNMSTSRTASRESVFAVSARAVELRLSFVGPVAIHNTDIFHPMCCLGTELP